MESRLPMVEPTLVQLCGTDWRIHVPDLGNRPLGKPEEVRGLVSVKGRTSSHRLKGRVESGGWSGRGSLEGTGRLQSRESMRVGRPLRSQSSRGRFPSLRSAEDYAAAEDRHRTVFAHRDHCRTFVVVAVAQARRMPGTTHRLDGLFRSVTRHQPHTELTEHAFGVEDGRPVDLSQGMSQRSQMRRLSHVQRGGSGSRSSTGGPGSESGR